MRTKHNGVRLPLGLPMLEAYVVIEATHQKLTEREAVITSGQDGKHMEGSKHYTGEAVDIRIWYTDSFELTQEFADMLAEQLGEDYDVVYGDERHRDHIHLEYDPK